MIRDICKAVTVAVAAVVVGIVALVVAVHIYAAYWQSVSQELQNAQSGQVQP